MSDGRRSKGNQMAHGMTDGAADRDAPGGEPLPDAANNVLAEALAADK